MNKREYAKVIYKQNRIRSRIKDKETYIKNLEELIKQAKMEIEGLESLEIELMYKQMDMEDWEVIKND